MSAFDPKPWPVLYVDDEVNNVTVFRLAFGERFTVLTASSAAEALKVLADEPVAVVLSDQRMPGMSGVQLVERLARDRPDVVRLITTAYMDLETLVDGVNRGHVFAFVLKPWTPPQMERVLEEAVREFAQHALAAQLLGALGADDGPPCLLELADSVAALLQAACGGLSRTPPPALERGEPASVRLPAAGLGQVVLTLLQRPRALSASGTGAGCRLVVGARDGKAELELREHPGASAPDAAWLARLGRQAQALGGQLSVGAGPAGERSFTLRWALAP